MNKYLLGTTALVAASLIAGMASAAEPLKVGVSGNMQQWFGVVNQTSSGEAGSNTVGTTTGANDYANTGLNTDTEIDFKAKTTLDNGLEVEARVELDVVENGGGTAGANAPNAMGLDEEWASIGSAKFGKIYAGVKESINDSMHNEAMDVGIGYGDVDQWVANPSGSATFATNNPWDATSLKNLVDDSASVSYITPQFYGLQFGTTFAPNGGANTAAASIGPANQGYHQSNAWDTTLSYTGKLAGVSIGIDGGVGGSQGSEIYQSTVTASSNVWNTGLKLSYAGFTLGGSLFGLEDSLGYNAKTAASGVRAVSRDGKAWNAGLSYANGPWATSFLYYHEDHIGNVRGETSDGLQATAGRESFSTYLLSGKYALGPGIDAKASGFYAQYDGRNYRAANTNYDTKGIGLVTGLDLTF